jgi:type II secretory pathway predicted ATPase ExeA
LTGSPFRGRFDPAAFYESPTHEEALARLDFLVDQRRRLGLLIGPPGSGKSVLLEHFARTMRDQGWPTVLLGLTGIESDEFPALLATGLGLNPARKLPAGVAWRLVADRLAEFRYQQTATVVLLDDADCAASAVLTQVTRLARSDPACDCRLTIALAGQPTRMSRLPQALLELADLRIDVEAWEPAETARFVEDSLRKAGRTTPVFVEPAVTRLHELAEGIPRRVSQLADLALLAGAGLTLSSIDAEIVDSACRELGAVEVREAD